MHVFVPVSLAALATLVAPSVAAAGPSLRATPAAGEPGDEVILQGRGWVSDADCSNRIALSFRQDGRRLKLGSAVHGGGRFDFETHYQRAEPGPARFVAVQTCQDRRIRRAAHVTVGGEDRVRYRGRTEYGGRVSFLVVDGSVVTRFRFVNRCASDRERGSVVPGTMPIGDVSFSRRGGRFRIFGRFRSNDVVKGNARERVMGCDSGTMTWRAERVG